MPEQNKAEIIISANFGEAEEARQEFENQLSQTEANISMAPEKVDARRMGGELGAYGASAAEDVVGELRSMHATLRQLVDVSRDEVSATLSARSQQRSDVASGKTAEGSQTTIAPMMGNVLRQLGLQIAALMGVTTGIGAILRGLDTSVTQMNQGIKSEIDRLAQYNPAIAFAQMRLEFAEIKRDMAIGKEFETDIVKRIEDQRKWVGSFGPGGGMPARALEIETAMKAEDLRQQWVKLMGDLVGQTQRFKIGLMGLTQELLNLMGRVKSSWAERAERMGPQAPPAPSVPPVPPRPAVTGPTTKAADNRISGRTQEPLPESKPRDISQPTQTPPLPQPALARRAETRREEITTRKEEHTRREERVAGGANVLGLPAKSDPVTTDGGTSGADFLGDGPFKDLWNQALANSGIGRFA